jgi:hypothetical protein
MELYISVSGRKTPEEVLQKIAKTIKSTNPGHEPGTYTKDSCYGAIAWYLKAEDFEDWGSDWTIYIFGGFLDMVKDPFHAVVYDRHQHRIVDTETTGHIFDADGEVFYKAKLPDGSTTLPCMKAISIPAFKKIYF